MASLVRVCATDAAGVCDISFKIPPATPPKIVFTVEASSSEFEAGAAYRVSGFVRDYESGTVAALLTVNGALQDANWDTRNDEIEFTLPAAITAVAAVNGIVEIVGLVRVGAAVAGASAAMETSMFAWIA